MPNASGVSPCGTSTALYDLMPHPHQLCLQRPFMTVPSHWKQYSTSRFERGLVDCVVTTSVLQGSGAQLARHSLLARKYENEVYTCALRAHQVVDTKLHTATRFSTSTSRTKSLVRLYIAVQAMHDKDRRNAPALLALHPHRRSNFTCAILYFARQAMHFTHSCQAQASLAGTVQVPCLHVCLHATFNMLFICDWTDCVGHCENFGTVNALLPCRICDNNL